MTGETYAGLAATILDRPARLGPTRLVAVDGRSGAGKSVFARALADAFPVRPPVVNTDDFLDGWDDQFTFWPRLDGWVLAPLRAGLDGRYRRYDWHRRAFGDAWTTVPSGPVVILEGVSAARAAVRPEVTFAVFVDAPREVALERTLRRDGEDLRPYLEVWQAREDRHFAADGTAARADLVVDGTRYPAA